MRKLLAKLFGFEYIIFYYGHGDVCRRVKKSATGREYVKKRGNYYFLNRLSYILIDVKGNTKPYINL